MTFKKFRTIPLALSLLMLTPGLAKAACPLTPAERGYVKWNPGHYISITGDDQNTRVTEFINNYRTVTNMKGVQKSYFWSQVEKANGSAYIWTQIDNDIARLSAAGKKLAIIITYKYEIDEDHSSLPAYILNLPDSTVGSLTNVPSYFEQGKPGDGPFNRGQHANFGHPTTRAKFNALLSALAARYDNNPHVAAISFIETSTGADITAAQQQNFLNGVMAMERHAGCVFKKTPVFQNLNYPRPMLQEFTANMKAYGIGLGGPDVFWGTMSSPTSGLGFVSATNPGIYHYHNGIPGQLPGLSDVLPIGMQVHKENFKYATHELYLDEEPHNLTPTDSVNKLYNFANNTLKANYIFWFTGGPADPYGNALETRLKSSSSLPLRTVCPAIYGGNGTGKKCNM